MYGTGTSLQVGVSTPESCSSPRPFRLTHGSLETSCLVPTNLHVHASQLKERFVTSLPAATDGLVQDGEPSSVPELVARYLGFVCGEIEKGEDDAQSSYVEVLKVFLDEFERAFLRGNEAHTLAATLPGIEATKLEVIRSYYVACTTSNRACKPHESALLRAADDGTANIYTIFGGQGNIEEYFEELRQVVRTYPSFTDELIASAAEQLQTLSSHPGAEKMFPMGLSIMDWLYRPESTPSIDYLISAPVSFPLIGLIQMAHYEVTCKVLGIDPGELREHISGTTGYSQGIVTAAATAAASSWASWRKIVKSALSILFWIGMHSQQAFPTTSMTPAMLLESMEHGEGTPTPMLSIRGLSQPEVQEHIDATNQYLPAYRHIKVSLINGPRNLVVTGPPVSLYGLNCQLHKVKAPTELDQTRVPYSERKVRFTNRFLPITAPFHSQYLAKATTLIDEELKDVSIESDALGVPLFSTKTGKDLRTEVRGNIVPALVRLITRDPVNWEKATAFAGATHILDFGPGTVSGLGTLTSRNKEGTGVRIILAGTVDGPITEVGYKSELFDRGGENAIKYAIDWVKEFGPRLVKTSSGRTFVDTKMSRLLGLPPVMVAGMAPATVPWDFVAATMNAGYHIELAGGGYFNAEMMEEALHKIGKAIPSGRGITVNLLYVNPRAMSWQIPLIGRLRAEGMPIDGMTIGAGVPSIEVAQEYIETLGLKHIGFKPGSVEAIQTVINIAKANPSFPVILQWTGGRGGGHHSFEDFHQPVLLMYSRIRRQTNIVLVAGSGFGGAEDTYPYITGDWSKKYGYPPMPFDGCLFGSRMMVAKEAHTSKDAKQAIVDAPGLEDDQWEKTYLGPAGGVITVRSEMGEPIHKLATRGVRFWAEMDREIFSLPKERRVPELKKRRQYIIKKLNNDFQKVWFGCNKAGQAVDLENMTYAEVVRRLVDLLYVKHWSRWIDLSFRKLTGDFIHRVEERFIASAGQPSLLQNYADLDEPFGTVDRILAHYPQAETQIINAQDVQHFLLLCMRPGQKPVTFIPALDENFEYFFKKDSLWQSENLDAVVGQDVGRTCILQGPMAVKFSTILDEPIKDILEGIHKAHIAALRLDCYNNDESAIPVMEYFGGLLLRPAIPLNVEGLTLSQDAHKNIYHLSSSASIDTPPLDDWLSLLAGPSRNWRHALLMSNVIVQGQKLRTNPMRRIFAPVRGLLVEIQYPDEPEKTCIVVSEQSRLNKYVKVIEVKSTGKNDILVNLIKDTTAFGKPVPLPLKFEYLPEAGYAPIHEVMHDRNNRIKEFYWKTWFGSGPLSLDAEVMGKFNGDSATITGEAINNFVHAVGNTNEAFVNRPGEVMHAPMDFAIVLGWKAITKPIFSRIIDGDLLRLVHLFNQFHMIPGAEPLKEGDEVSTTAQVNAVVNQESGKMVEVCGTLLRDGQPVMEVTSQFLYRGAYTDYENTFQRKVETPVQVHLPTSKDVAVLRSKHWFVIEERPGDIDLLGKTLTFRLQSLVRYKSNEVFSSVQTRGQVLLDIPTKGVIQVASVDYEAGESHGNPVIDYLERIGSPVHQPIYLENPIPLSGKTPLQLRAPASNEAYARVSGDYNPIHVSRVFSSYVNLPGTVTHGMYTSAAIRSLIETWAAKNDIGRIRKFNASLVGIVLPCDNMSVKLHHVAMVAGRKIIKVDVSNTETEEMVLVGYADIEQPVTAYIFTGQGSQEQGMGMDLYASSPVAKRVWDRADKYLLDNYGFSITNIVKNNPKELTIHFGGPSGKAIRQNYMAMAFEAVAADGSIKSERIFKNISESTTSYTYRSPTGLLSATHFAQPALTLMEKASFEDMKSKSLVPRDSTFAGHSLGEYAALAALADVMPIESLVSVVFYRGLTMQVAVERDATGRSNHSMCAVNPSRISKTFNEEALQVVVKKISEETGWLLEIVNYNVADMQYVCAGDLRALDTLVGVINFLRKQSVDLDEIRGNIESVKGALKEIIRGCVVATLKKPQPLELERGFATIPLTGIDVPFHSTFLRPGVKPFRSFLLKKIKKTMIDPTKLVGKYIPNLTAKPFALSKDYFEDVYKLTNSPKIGEVLANWDKYVREDGTADNGH